MAGLTFSGSIQGIKIAPGAARAGQVPDHRDRLHRRPGHRQDVRRRADRRPARRHPQARQQPRDHRRRSTRRPRCSSGSSTSASRAASPSRAWPASRSASASASSARSRCSSTSRSPAGIMLVPQIGLAINDFAARRGVLQDPALDRGPVRAARTRLRPPDRRQRRDVADLAAEPGGTPGQDDQRATPTVTGSSPPSPHRWSSPGSARIYSIFTSQQVFNGQVTVKISTDGKLLIVGKLNFADDNISISGRLYADLSKVATGQRRPCSSSPTSPTRSGCSPSTARSRWASSDSSGNEVTFDAVSLPDPVATGTRPTVDTVTPAPGGGRVDAGVINKAGTKYVDVVFTAPNGAALDLASILDSDAEFDHHLQRQPRNGPHHDLRDAGADRHDHARRRRPVRAARAHGRPGDVHVPETRGEL